MDHKLIPLFSISGLTLFSISGLIYLKTKESTPLSSPTINIIPTPTQVPKSIEHYLLASQQFFTQALDAQNQQKSPETVTNLLNRSLSFANESIKIFPDDFRAYLQRGQIYLSLTRSQPKLIDTTINDYLTASNLNPNSAEITRTLASLYAQKGDAQSTLNFLSKTVSLEPTKAQNFYDLAKIQQQAGDISNALSTYNQLLTILTDPTQKNQVESEKTALEKLLSQNPQPPSTISPLPSTKIDEPLLQASLPDSGLIIAAPETSPNITVKDQTDSNSLSGNATLLAGTKEITINNSQLNNSSQIYLTIISGGKNQSLELISKSTNSFTVGLLSPTTQDIVFKWWIVN